MQGNRCSHRKKFQCNGCATHLRRAEYAIQDAHRLLFRDRSFSVRPQESLAAARPIGPATGGSVLVCRIWHRDCSFCGRFWFLSFWYSPARTPGRMKFLSTWIQTTTGSEDFPITKMCRAVAAMTAIPYPRARLTSLPMVHSGSRSAVIGLLCRRAVCFETEVRTDDRGFVPSR